MNRGGQTIMVGILVLVMAIILFIATLPALTSIFNTARERDSLNCVDYVYAGDADHARSYNASYETDTLTCTILDIGIPYLVLGVLVSIISLLIAGRLVSKPEPQVPSYYGGY